MSDGHSTYNLVRRSRRYRHKRYYNRYKLWESSTTFWGRCKLPRRWKVPKIIETQNLASIRIQKLDMLLKRRLYELSFPLIRKRLWSSSKSTSNLGKKPITYAVDDVIVKKQFVLIKRFRDAVLLCTFYCNFEDLSSVDMLKVLRFVDFQHTNCVVTRTKIDPKYYQSFFHQGLVRLYLEYCIVFETVLEIVPPVSIFLFRGILPKNWEFLLSKWQNPELKCCMLMPREITDFKVLSSWVCQRKWSFKLRLSGRVTYNEDEISEYFLKSDSCGGGKLSFEGYPKNRYYVCKEDPSSCSIL